MLYQHNVDVVFGPLFGHVVGASAARAGELKMPLFIVSEGSELADGQFNRYVFQTGITNVRSQVTAISPWVIAIPPTETSFTKYFSQIPPDSDAIYHVMVGPGVLTFVRELGEFFGSKGPKLFGFIDSIEAVDIASPGLEFLEGSHLWEAFPRYLSGLDSEGAKFYRNAVGIDENGASKDNAKEVSTNSHMFGCWETLFSIKQAVEASGYKAAGDRKALIEGVESTTSYAGGKEHPQGEKKFLGRAHQCFGRQFISQVEGGKLKVVHTTSIEDGLYEPKADYTTQAL